MANDRRCSFGSFVAALALLASAFVTTARADEVWVAPTYQQDIGGLGVASNVIWRRDGGRRRAPRLERAR